MLFGLPGLGAARRGATCRACRVAAEGFADRAYEPDGSLTPRSQPGSVIHDPDEVVRRALRMVGEGRVTASDGVELRFRVDTTLHARRHAWRARADAAAARGARAGGYSVAPCVPPGQGSAQASDARHDRARDACCRGRTVRLVARGHAGGAARADRGSARLDARRVRRDAVRAGAHVDHGRPRVGRDTAGALGLRHAAGVGRRRHALRRHRRSLRPHARADGERAASTRSSPPPAASPTTSGSSRCSACCSASAWAANGRAARRSCRKPGRREHRGKALGFMQSAWAIGYGRRRWSP